MHGKESRREEVKHCHKVAHTPLGLYWALFNGQDALANYHGLSHAYVSVTCHCACQAVNAVKSKVKLRFRRSIILTAVADVSTGPIGVSASCSTHIHNYINWVTSLCHGGKLARRLFM